MSLNEVSIKIPGEYIPNVFGQFDAFAKKIERTLHVTLVLRDDSLKIIGAQGNIDGEKGRLYVIFIEKMRINRVIMSQNLIKNGTKSKGL
jgi:phosphate starvation-inducible PhoH-like protein